MIHSSNERLMRAMSPALQTPDPPNQKKRGRGGGGGVLSELPDTLVGTSIKIPIIPEIWRTPEQNDQTRIKLNPGILSREKKKEAKIGSVSC